MLDSTTTNRPRKVSFLLIPQFALFSFTAAVEPLRSANRMSGKELYQWELLSSDGKPVASSSGITLMPNRSIQDVSSCETVAVCAGLDPQLFNDRATFSWLRTMARHGTYLGGISAGAYVLARAGLLNGYRCTIHWEYLAAFAEEFPELEVTPSLFEIDRNRFTAAGSEATMDMMLHLIAKQHGYDLSVTVAEQFSHISIHGENEPQRMPLRQRLRISHPKLIAIIEQMETNLEEPLTRESLAQSVGLSTRQMERLFEKYLHKSPARHYLELRLKRAQLLLMQTSMSILDVSVACGFVSASHFSKSYREMFNRPPRQERAPSPLRVDTADQNPGGTPQ
ncbi:MAG: GlxA family transcriptional regulator [Rhodospirillales bacterium]